MAAIRNSDLMSCQSAKAVITGKLKQRSDMLTLLLLEMLSLVLGKGGVLVLTWHFPFYSCDNLELVMKRDGGKMRMESCFPYSNFTLMQLVGGWC